jgi:hypothetical protein
VASNSGIKTLSKIFWKEVTIPIFLYAIYSRGNCISKCTQKLKIKLTKMMWHYKTHWKFKERVAINNALVKLTCKANTKNLIKVDK